MESKIEEEVENEEGYEPQVYSKNPLERISARRLRIQRRADALKRQKDLQEAQEAAGDSGLEVEVEKTPIDVQVEKSLELLEKLILEGDEYVTNVKIATEAREADRREREGIGKEKLLKDLDDEAQAASNMFHEITNKWGEILKYNDPLHINDDIQNQKEKCDELIKQKDEMIANLKELLRKSEINFSVDQKKQIEDVNSISKRIENQIIAIRKSYRAEIQMVENVILAERQLLIEASNKKWEELYKKRDQEEKNNADLRSEDYWMFVKDMDDLVRDFLELYRKTTIKLENDCDSLQRELERIKTETIMNSEKLDYNYQILKKREDENLIIRSQQKRRINKLQDMVNLLRKKNADYHSQTFEQIAKLGDEIQRLSKNILDVERKADHMATVNNEKFEKIWKMNKKRADDLFKRILDIDKVLHEQQLGLKWIPPDYALPTKTDMESYKNAVYEIRAQKKTTASDVSTYVSVSKPDLQDSKTETEGNSYAQKTIETILNLIADKSGFLIEDQLLSILDPYLENERTLIKIDNIFAALHLEDKNDIDLLFSFFMPYMFCPICNIQSDKPGITEIESLMHVHEMDAMQIPELTPVSDHKDRSTDAITGLLRDVPLFNVEEVGTSVVMGPLTVTLYDDHLKGGCKGIDKATLDEHMREAEKKVTGSVEDLIKISCQQQHPLMICSVYVLKAMKEFLAKYHVPKSSIPTMTERLTKKRNTVSRLMSSSDIAFYWQKYIALFPSEREQLWDSLLEGLKKYHELLKVRKSTSEQVVNLRQQNADLRRVFSNYLDKNDIPY